jgi:hypothetical protein
MYSFVKRKQFDMQHVKHVDTHRFPSTKRVASVAVALQASESMVIRKLRNPGMHCFVKTFNTKM